MLLMDLPINPDVFRDHMFQAANVLTDNNAQFETTPSILAIPTVAHKCRSILVS